MAWWYCRWRRRYWSRGQCYTERLPLIGTRPLSMPCGYCFSCFTGAFISQYYRANHHRAFPWSTSAKSRMETIVIGLAWFDIYWECMTTRYKEREPGFFYVFQRRAQPDVKLYHSNMTFLEREIDLFLWKMFFFKFQENNLTLLKCPWLTRKFVNFTTDDKLT